MRRRSRPGPRARGTGIGPILHKIGTGVFVAALAVMAVQANLPRILTANTAVASDSFTGRVTRIVDGDTFWLSAKNDRVRVWGLDAPELNTPGGSAATAMLTRLISGQTLSCRKRDIDRYGRIVGQCFLPDGRDITAAMIESGTAQGFCRYSGNHYGTC